MKVNKTLSLDYSIVQELKQMNNQSAFVNAAILKRLSGRSGVDHDIPTRMLMAALLARDDCPAFLKKAIKLELRHQSPE